MEIIKRDDFSLALDNILDYLARDGVVYAVKFNKQLEKAISSISNFPYKSRKSLYHDNENIRDYIFKGYTIPYLIDSKKNQIALLDIFKWVNK
jgi:plasmid stabilization system protein ParE